MRHSQVRRGLDGLFLGDPMTSALEVRDHLRGCSRCRRHFHDLVHAERALGGGLPEEETFERRYSDAVMTTHIRQPSGRNALLRWFEGLRPVWFLCAALFVAALGLFFFGAEAPSQPEDFTPRGAHAPVDGPSRSAGGGVHRLNAYCYTATAPEGERISAPSDGVLECGLSSEIKFEYINAPAEPGAELPFLTLVGIDEGARIHRYNPAEAAHEGGASMQIGLAQRPTFIGETLLLENGHDRGQLWIHGVFSASPLPISSIAQRLRSGGMDPSFDGVAIEDPSGREVVMGSSGPGRYAVSTVRVTIVAASKGARGLP